MVSGVLVDPAPITHPTLPVYITAVHPPVFGLVNSTMLVFSLLRPIHSGFSLNSSPARPLTMSSKGPHTKERVRRTQFEGCCTNNMPDNASSGNIALFTLRPTIADAADPWQDFYLWLLLRYQTGHKRSMPNHSQLNSNRSQNAHGVVVFYNL